MHSLILFVLIFVNSVRRDAAADIISSNRYCANMNHQSYVAIEQLMGMWYGVEVISHKLSDEKGKEYTSTCPIIHISEDNSPSTPSPYHRGLYGTRYGSTNYRSPYPTQGSQQGPYDQGSYDANSGYGRHNDRDGYRRDYNNDHRQQFGHDYPPKPGEEIKFLRLLWDENGNDAEYSLRYNVSRAGFWISSGPQNGSSLDPPFNQFAGAIQVIKAVGNHLVLTVCHQLPDQQLFTVVLSRVPHLPRHDINDVHELLQHRGLDTHNVRKELNLRNNLNFVRRLHLG